MSYAAGCGVAWACVLVALTDANGDTGDLTCVMAGTCATGCDCTDVCPFSRSYTPRPRNVASWRRQRPFRPFIRTSVGTGSRSRYRRIRFIEQTAQAAATWCLEKLLQHGEVTRVAVVRFAQDRRKAFSNSRRIHHRRNPSSVGGVYHPWDLFHVRGFLPVRSVGRWLAFPPLCGDSKSSRLTSKVPTSWGLPVGCTRTRTTRRLPKAGFIRPGDRNHFCNKAPKAGQ